MDGVESCFFSMEINQQLATANKTRKTKKKQKNDGEMKMRWSAVSSQRSDGHRGSPIQYDKSTGSCFFYLMEAHHCYLMVIVVLPVAYYVLFHIPEK